MILVNHSKAEAGFLAGGDDEHQYQYHLHQVPSSWGAVYFCRPWQDFRKYAAARTNSMFDREELGATSLEGGRPGDPNFHIDELHSNWWSKSWKKYMVEYVYANALLTVYPSLQTDNIGLVMHLAIKGGEHMKTKNTPFEAADLATYSMVTDSINGNIPLDKARIFDIHFETRAGIMGEMKKAGIKYAESLYSKGPPYSDIAPLLLFLSPQWPEKFYYDHNDATQQQRHHQKQIENNKYQTKNDKAHRYLGYMPQGGQGNQLHSLAKALWLSAKLDRILLIPHLFLPSCTSDFNFFILTSGR